jgi:hypothetical protein
MEIKRLIGSIVALLMMTCPTMAGIPGNPKMDAFLSANQKEFNTQLRHLRARNYTCVQAMHKRGEGFSNMSLNTDDSIAQRKTNVVWFMAISKVADKLCDGSIFRTGVAIRFNDNTFPNYLKGKWDLCVGRAIVEDKEIWPYFIATNGKHAQVCPLHETDTWEKPAKDYDF